MKTSIAALFITLFWWNIGFAQFALSTQIDSLKHELAIASQDTSRVLLLDELCYVYMETKSELAKTYGEKALTLAKKIKFSRGEAVVLSTLGRLYRILGNYPKALNLEFRALQIAEDYNYWEEKSDCLGRIGAIYMELQDYPKAKRYFKQVEALLEFPQAPQDEHSRLACYSDLLWWAIRSKDLDANVKYLKKVKENFSAIKTPRELAYYNLQYGQAQFLLGDHQGALQSIRQSIAISENNHNVLYSSWANCIAAEFFNTLGQPDSVVMYAKNGLLAAQEINYPSGIRRASNLLVDLYDPGDIAKAFYYSKIAKTANDQIYGAKKVQNLQKALADEQERQRIIAANRIAYQNRMTQYALLTGLAVLLLIGFILYRNNRQKQKSNAVLEKALSTLKSTQAQLIQSEKLASLGELTAGIAHEIQNPLNFVNNFSELNRELITEMKEEIDKGNYGEVKTIAEDLETNEERINHHGQRASSIVKGMLEHSRASTGVKEPTDLNALADEYLRLAYHGLRAKDDNFNAMMETHFDPDLPLVSVIPQDIGRVLLNLINNAFYVVNEKAKQGIEGYQPTVTISSRKLENAIEIRVQDNGPGIPESIKDKIFQPFFTTKPTGQGTGLGLSLAYDIVVKGHGGTLELDSTEGTGTVLTLKLNLI